MVVMKQKNDTRNLLRCLSDVVVKWGEINIGPSVMLGLYEPKVPEKLKTSIKKKIFKKDILGVLLLLNGGIYG